ncbi:hypothetical protein CPX_001376 [Candidatus Phytoplasma pruni]|uniref:Uncharacterized protein n=1 Tax=Candidatus Phytoplasma pruni TaxID=479893 RepID=A0A0M1N0J1_9MOLU|nr:hypothetical protein [Candidatus Phytoplasma pruni]KOR75672.1 hypothetical protein CPX_001376 [Candidatus Phytoplasma pruni]
MATSAAKDAAIKQVFEVIELLIENNPNALELVNNIIIIPIENVAMGITDLVDYVPIICNVTGLGCEIYQTYSTVTDTPTEMLRKTGKTFSSRVNRF